MIEWGISANSHNAALAVFKDNQLVFASESERFSKIKNDPHLHYALINEAEKYGKPDVVYWYEKPWLKTARQFLAGQGLNLRENNIKEYLASYNITCPIKYTGHHHSHAAAGYYTSNSRDACVIVIDSIGEFDTLTIWHGHQNNLKKVYSLKYPHSVGLWYSAMTDRIDLKANEEEYILMGMAATGKTNLLTKDMLAEWINFGNKDPITFKENFHKGIKDWRKNSVKHENIAASTQLIYEMIFERVLQTAVSLVPSKNLVLMGGCALNCAANPIAYKYFDDVWIMPAPGDNGSAIGAVLAHKKQHIQWPGAFLGYDMGYQASNEEIVEHLIKHQICGVARGPAEFGPRALGNRSLLADPRGNDIKDKVNGIKQREKFRPFAPVILEELSTQYFDMPGPGSSRYMQMVATCRNPELFPAIVHIDGTSRVQTCPADGSPLRQLLELWYERTGCPMLLNTSLNIKGEPMINTHSDAIEWQQKYGVQVFN